MKQVSERLTYGNVMSTLFIFLLLAGGTAVAAKQLGKKTVGAKQMKANAVTTAKIKKAAVTKAKIRDGAIDSAKMADNAVTGSKILDGAVGGADIAAGSTPFSQRIARLQKNEVVPMTASAAYPLGAWTQSSGEVNQILGAVDVQFAAGCTQPRTFVAYVLIDAGDPAAPQADDISGLVVAQDKGAGTVTRRVDLVAFPSLGSLYRLAPTATTLHRIDLSVLAASCTGGSGVSLVGATVDVIGTR